MPWCPVCGTEYQEDQTVCPDCSAKLTEMPPADCPKPGPEADPIRSAPASYTSAREMQSETRSSAWTFLIIGLAGFAVVTLALAGFLRLPFGLFSLAVLEIMFVIFLVIAGLSFRKAMRLLDDIAKEETLEERINSWAAEHLAPDSLTCGIDPDTPEELRYFEISERIRERIKADFPEVDDAHAEELAEHFYNML